MNKYCDNCGRKKPLRIVILEDERGEAEWCFDCIENNPQVIIKGEKEGDNRV